jgi:hypothetical protein
MAAMRTQNPFTLAQHVAARATMLEIDASIVTSDQEAGTAENRVYFSQSCKHVEETHPPLLLDVYR